MIGRSAHGSFIMVSTAAIGPVRSWSVAGTGVDITGPNPVSEYISCVLYSPEFLATPAHCRCCSLGISDILVDARVVDGNADGDGDVFDAADAEDASDAGPDEDDGDGGSVDMTFPKTSLVRA